MKKILLALMLVIFVIIGTSFAGAGFQDLGVMGGNIYHLDLETIEEYQSCFTCQLITVPKSLNAINELITATNSKNSRAIGQVIIFSKDLKHYQYGDISIFDEYYNIIKNYKSEPDDSKYVKIKSNDVLLNKLQQAVLRYLKKTKYS